MSETNTLITGGCGFIGSHLSEELDTTDNNIFIVDDMSNGEIAHASDGVEDVYECDLTDYDSTEKVIRDVQPDVIYHLAAKSNVRSDGVGTGQFNHNTKITSNIVRVGHKVGYPDIAFASSSTVYGHPDEVPVDEESSLNPESYYGAGKIGSESILRTYENQTDANVNIFRLANIVGGRLRGAVIPDFIEKLFEDSEELEILGNGKQMKSYMHVEDCVNAMLHIQGSDTTVVNIGVETTTTVDRIADIVSEEMQVQPSYNYTGGSKGWTGDVPKIKMDVHHMESLGYNPEMTSDQAVRKAAEELIDEIRSE